MAANEVAELVAQATPYVTAAAGAYGGAVLTRTRDRAADATVGVGLRLLQRVFGRREPDDLPEPLADIVAYPGDADLLAALKVTIRKALERDAAMLAEVRSILADAPAGTVTQHVHAGRDAYVSGQNMTIHQRRG